MTQSVPDSEHVYPAFLSSYGSFYSYLQSHLEGLNSQKKGEVFAKLAERLIPLTSIGSQFQPPVSNKQTHDGGVDFVSRGRDNQDRLFSQSKYTIAGVDDFDTVISKFEDYQRTR